MEQAKELCRKQRSWRWLEQFLQDLRFGGRGLLKAPRVTATVVVTLALGRPEYFSHALEAEDVTGLDHAGLSGAAAHPQRHEAVAVS